MSLDTLKRTNSLDKLLGDVQKRYLKRKNHTKTKDCGNQSFDKSGNGYGVIRFLFLSGR